MGKQTRGWNVNAVLWLASAIACGGSSSIASDGGSISIEDGSSGDVTLHEDGGGGADATDVRDAGAGDSGRHDASTHDASADDSGRQGDAAHEDAGDAATDSSSDASHDADASARDASDSSALDANDSGAGAVHDADVGAQDASDSSVLDANPCGPNAAGVPMYHRPDDSQCSQPAPPGGCFAPPGLAECDADITCTAGTNGRCIGNYTGPFCFCTYDTCAVDTDCPAGKLCACHGSAYTYGAGNTCTAGTCRVDSDCGDAGYCSPSPNTETTSGMGLCGAVVTGYYCHTPLDECVSDCDCTQFKVCAWSSASASWSCQQPMQPCP